MVVFNSTHCFTLSLFHTPSPCLAPTRKSFSTKSSGALITCSVTPMDGRAKLMEFPYVSAPVRNLMVDLVTAVEDRLNSQLLPCTLPPDVQYFQNQTGNAQAALQIRSGHHSSQVDIILASWLHCELPTGGALNITSLSGYLNSSTDAPNLMIELIQSSPTSLVLILDLPHRKDLALHPDYLTTFYESTQLDTLRQKLEKLPEVTPYFSPSLFIRCVSSPTATMVRVQTESESARMEEIIASHVNPVAKELLSIWLNECACEGREVDETEKAELEKRDRIVRNKTVEVDLASSFPRLFGQDVADRVVAEIRKALIG